MIDVEDPGTVAMPLEVKRGRGRPRKVDALTPAQRAARYRARRGVVIAAGDNVTNRILDEQVVEYRRENCGLRNQVAYLLEWQEERVKVEQDLRDQCAALMARNAELAVKLADADPAREVTKKDDSTSRHLLAVAERMRAFARDPGAILKPATLHQWARVLEKCAE